MKGYKAFKKGLICAPDKSKPFQFAENTVYETDEAKICESGFHFCRELIDTLCFYPLIDEDGNLTEFAEVEAFDEAKTDGGKKYCTKKIKIGKKLSFEDLLTACLTSTCESAKKEAESGGDDAQLVGGDGAQLVGGDYAKLVGGDYAKLVGGYYAQLVGGDFTQLVGGDYAKLVGGYYAKLVGGYDAQLVGGDFTRLVGGDYAKLVGGDYAKLVGGYYAKLVGGKHSILTGDNRSFAKGKKGALIVLVERKWQGKEYVIKNYKAEIVDGERIKEDVFYKLENGEFKEVT